MSEDGIANQCPKCGAPLRDQNAPEGTFCYPCQHGAPVQEQPPRPTFPWQEENASIINVKEQTEIYDREVARQNPVLQEIVNDPVNHPKHYTSHPSGVECIQIVEHMQFNLGNVMKYIWRADHANGIQDLEKARWYLDREIQKRQT